MAATPIIDYLAPDIPAALPWCTSKLVRATPETLRGYGELVMNYKEYPIEIVQWPKTEGRPIRATA